MRAGCVAFVLDDLQFADAASVEAMRMLAEPKPVSTTADRAVDERIAVCLRGPARGNGVGVDFVACVVGCDRALSPHRSGSAHRA